MYSTGHIREPEGHLYTPVVRLGVSVQATEASLIPHATPVLDQGQTGSCEGHGVGGAIYACMAAAGRRLPWIPSPKGVYTVGRCVDRPASMPPLEDSGAMTYAVVRGLSLWGIRRLGKLAADGRMSDCEPDEIGADGQVIKKINAEPTLEELEADSHTLLGGAYAITSKGQQRSDEVAACISNGIPVVLAVPGGSPKFQGYQGGIMTALHAEVDHCVYVIGYGTLPDGTRFFVIRNSWGDWGEDGNCRVNEAFLDECQDLFAMKMRLA